MSRRAPRRSALSTERVPEWGVSNLPDPQPVKARTLDPECIDTESRLRHDRVAPVWAYFEEHKTEGAFPRFWGIQLDANQDG